MTLAALLPVKAFAVAKARLAPALAPAEREALARRLAAGVVEALAGVPVAVVCDDPGVAGWAAGLGAMVVEEPGRGLNGAVQEGVSRLAASGFDTVAVVHADLAQPGGLAAVLAAADPGGVTLVPDGRDDGTNVAVVPAAAGFRFAYGPGSFRRHVDEAARCGLACTVVRGSPLSLDVDVPADLAATRA